MVKIYNRDECIDALAVLSNAKVISTEQEEEIETEIMNLDEVVENAM